MNSVKKASPKAEQNRHAQANSSNTFESAPGPKNGSESGAETEIPNQQSGKAHCFCPKFAKLHGERAAVIVQGLGHKVAKSKKERDGRKWHYDTLEALEERWPYMRDSGIGGIVERLQKQGHVTKGRYNKWRKDKTTWYSVSDELVRRAMNEDGKIWFDVNAAIQCRSIVAGTLYQNVRYHLLCELADNPEAEVTSYCRVNKAALARILPWSLSTIKRGFEELVEENLFAQHPDRTTDYTICDPLDLVVPDGMKKHAAKKPATGSKTEKTSGSSTKTTGSTTEQSRSSTEKNVSSPENNTHYKPFTKPIHKHHSPTAAPSVGGDCADAAGAAQESGHQQGSSTVPDKEDRSSGKNSSARASNLSALFAISQRLEDLTPRIPADIVDRLKDLAHGCAVGFASEWDCSPGLIKARSCEGAEDCLNAFRPDLSTSFEFPSDIDDPDGDSKEFWMLSMERVVLAALLLSHADADALHPAVEDCSEAVWDCYGALPALSTLTDIPTSQKARELVAEIANYNEEGWPIAGGETMPFKFSILGSFATKAEDFFAQRPELSAEDVAIRLSDCIEVSKLSAKPKPNVFDPNFYTRRGVQPSFLFKYWDEIEAEVAA